MAAPAAERDLVPDREESERDNHDEAISPPPDDRMGGLDEDGEEKYDEFMGGAREEAKSPEDDNDAEEDRIPEFLTGLEDDEFLGSRAAIPPPPMVEFKDTVAVRGASELDEKELSDRFSSAAGADEIVVGLLSEDAVREAAREAEAARLRTLEEEAEERARKERQLWARERAARERVREERVSAEQRVSRRAAAEASAAEMAELEVRRRYRRVEEGLMERLRRQKAAVGRRYGALERDEFREGGGADGAATLARLRHGIRALWELVPVPMQIRLHVLRGAKNRLPRGRYALMCTLWDRLGGVPLRWTRLELGHGAPRLRKLARPAASRPVHHRGRYSDTELDFEAQALHTLIPPAADLRPSHVLVLELYRLRGNMNPVDHVVAWTAIPAANADLRPQNGRFRLPMLRGAVDRAIDQFSKLEDNISSSLENWLANLYIEIRPLPREELATDGSIVGEFDVEMEFASRLLLLDDSDKPNLDYLGETDPKKEHEEEEEEDGIILSGRGSASAKQHVSPTPSKPRRRSSASPHRSSPGKPRVSIAESTGSYAGGGRLRNVDADGKVRASEDASHLVEPTRADGYETDEEEEDAVTGGPGIVSGRQERSKVVGGLTRGSSMRSRKNATFHTAGGAMMASGSMRPDTGVSDASAFFVESLPPTPANGRGANFGLGDNAPDSNPSAEQEAARLSDLSTYRYAVTRAETRGLDRGRPLRETIRKMRYLRDELLSDLAPKRITRPDFWLWLLVLLCAIYVALHMHYVGQWLFLSWLRVPVYDFEPTGYGMTLKYVGSVLPMEYELGVVILGPLTNIGVFLVVIGIAAAALLTIGHFPETLSRYVAFTGIAACLDPLLILIIDVASGNYNCDENRACRRDPASDACRCFEGDAFKLYFRFLRDEGSGVIGVFLTVFVFVVLFMLAAFLLYVYLLRLHLDGRMLDLYRRLHAPERAFLVPDDLEMSSEELQAVLEESRNWRGPHGEKRRIGVCEYILTDPLDPDFSETTTHVVIYTAGLDGGRTLYRHFLRHADGSIVELFGNAHEYFGNLAGLQQILEGTKPGISSTPQITADGRQVQHFFQDDGA